MRSSNRTLPDVKNGCPLKPSVRYIHTVDLAVESKCICPHYEGKNKTSGKHYNPSGYSLSEIKRVQRIEHDIPLPVRGSCFLPVGAEDSSSCTEAV
jgi:hypothetical protein